MAFKDQLVRCGACGRNFVFTVREQRARADQGMSTDPPAFCHDCRGADVRLAEAATPPPAAVAIEAAEEAPAPAPRQWAPEPGPRAQGGPRRHATGGDRPPRRDDRPPRRGDRPGGRPQGGPHRGRGGPDRGRGGRPAPPRQTELRVRYTGTVKWFDEGKGYGFIAQDDGDDLFVHQTGVLADPPNSLLYEGQPVEYEVERTARGFQAVDVVPLA